MQTMPRSTLVDHSRTLLSLISIQTLHYSFFFFFNDTATTEIYTLSLHDALPIFGEQRKLHAGRTDGRRAQRLEEALHRSEEHTSELQSHHDLVCRLLLEKKKQKKKSLRHIF